jgi:O-antigen/teichoic acid export membrane protein
MTVGRILARNSVLNLAGLLGPLVAAIVATPLLIRGMGEARFGILTIAWAVVGYFSLFDLGLGRALTHAVSARRGLSMAEELGSVSWGSLSLMLLLGIIGAGALAAGTPLLVRNVLSIEPALHDESIRAFYLLALALPVTVLTSGLRGLLEAHQDFALATALRLPLGIFNFVGPLFVLPYSHGLPAIVGILVVGRFVGGALHVAACLHRYPFLRAPAFGSMHVTPLLRAGGWMTVSNVVSPLMVTLDRFMIGALLGVAAVAYYATPYEVVTKLLVLPSALLTVLFPEFAAGYARDRAETALLVERAVRLIVLAVFPATLIIVTFAHAVLERWLGAAFAVTSAPVLRWLAAGVLINAVGHVFFVALQGSGRPDLTAKLHLAELPFYLLAIWFLGHAFGLVGFAIAWTMRVGLDTLAQAVLTARRFPDVRLELGASMRQVAVLLAVLAVATMPTTTAGRALVLSTALVGFGIFAWRSLLLPAERRVLGSWLAESAPTKRA